MSNYYSRDEQKAHRQLWIAALRSGKYEQGYCCLRTLNNKYCCLGVACEVANANGLELKIDSNYLGYSYNEFRTFPPEEVKNFFGLKTIDGSYLIIPLIIPETTSLSLAKNNDTDQLSFEKIANIIESEPEGLFY